jgi:hypothetical protein
MPFRLQSSSVMQHWAKANKIVTHTVRISKYLMLNSKWQGLIMNTHVVDH